VGRGPHPPSAGSEQYQHVVLGPQRGQVLPAPHHERRDTDLARPVQSRAQQFVDLLILLAAGGEVVGAVEVDRLDPVEVDEFGDLDRLGAAGRDLVELVRLDDHVLASVEFVALDDVGAVDFLAGALVDAAVADAVGGAALQLVEVDGVILGGGVKADGNRDQAECDHACPDGPRHDRPPSRPSQSPGAVLSCVHARTAPPRSRAGQTAHAPERRASGVEGIRA